MSPAEVVYFLLSVNISQWRGAEKTALLLICVRVINTQSTAWH